MSRVSVTRSALSLALQILDRNAERHGQPTMREAADELRASCRDIEAPAPPSDDAGRVVESGNPEWLTCAHISSACLSYRHDYGLLEGTEKLRVWRDASKWLRVWMKEVPLVLASDLAAVRAERDALRREVDDLSDWLEAARGLVADLTRDRAASQQECERLRERLSEIGDYAHDRSTGPAVPDALWEIRAMAYEAVATSPAKVPAALATGGRHGN